MEKHERQLLAWSLPCAAKTLLVYGTESKRAELAAALAELCDSDVEEFDAAGAVLDEATLEEEIAARFKKAQTVLLSVGPKTSEALRSIVTQVQQRGEVKLGESSYPLQEGARLVVFSESMHYDEDDAAPFGLQIVGMRVLNEQRAKVTAAEAELRRRQERARQSSRQHGLV